MKKLIIISAGILAIVSGSSCSKMLESGMSGVKTVYESQPQEIAVSTLVGMPTKAAVTGTTFPTSRKFKMSSYFNGANGDTSAEYFEGVEFTYSTSSWKASSPKYWPLTGTLDFLAVSSGQATYPTLAWNDSNATSDVTITLTDNSSTQDDILVGCKAGASGSTSAVPIAFQHVESLIAFTVTGTTAVKINSITLDAHKTAGSCKVTRSSETLTPVWTPSGTGATKVISVSNGQQLTASAAAFGDAYLAIPQTGVGFKINYTCDGLTVTKSISAPVETWVAGKKYTYAINLTLDEILVTASITDWTSESKDVAI